MPFEPEFKFPAKQSPQALWFVFQKDKLLLKTNGREYSIPCYDDLAVLNLSPIRKQYLGALNGVPCYAAELPDAMAPADGLVFQGLRESFDRLQEELIWIAGRANQLVDWNRNHQFCGRCGQPTEDRTEERAKICRACGLINYPRLSPAVIVAVVKEDRLLLASNKRFKAGFYSVLAGFVEPGEHLAGALGTPVWCMVHPRPNIHYTARGETIPYYGQAVRMFRRESDEEWAKTVNAVAKELEDWLGARAAA